MKHDSLSGNPQGLVVFNIWKSLNYSTRLIIGLGLICAGFVIQYLTIKLFPGIIAVAAGNLLLLPKGYDNRVNLGKFHAHAEWEPVKVEKLGEFLKFQRKVKRWDISTMDISNPLGIFTFLGIGLILGLIALTFIDRFDRTMYLIFWNGVALIIPIWFSGMRRIFVVPEMTMKISLILKLLAKVEPAIKDHGIDFYFQLHGSQARVPRDVKFRINIRDHHPDFLGLYGQVVINQVQNAPYPYFYMVLVAKQNYGLKTMAQDHTISPRWKVEHKNQRDVEVMVIRQRTRGIRKGYTTRPKHVEALFRQTLPLAEKIARK
jgi:hypothetical protein